MIKPLTIIPEASEPTKPIEYKDIVWENVKLILNVSKREPTDPEFKYRKLVIEIEEWINRSKCHDSDIEDVSMTIADYEFEPGRWELEIAVTWVEDNCSWASSGEWEAEWDFVKQTKIKGK